MLSFHPMTQYALSNSSHKIMWIKTILNIYFYYLFFQSAFPVELFVKHSVSTTFILFQFIWAEGEQKSFYYRDPISQSSGIPGHHEKVAISLSADLCVFSVFSLRCSYTHSVWFQTIVLILLVWISFPLICLRVNLLDSVDMSVPSTLKNTQSSSLNTASPHPFFTFSSSRNS